MAITQSGIESVLAHALKTALTEWCITNVPASDESRADNVILGKPTRERRDQITISIHMQHPLGPAADKDAIATGSPMYPPETVGGHIVEKMMGTVQVNIRQDTSYEEAVDVIASVVERVKKCITTESDLVPLVDSWGNRLIRLETFQASGHASGGSNISINLRWIDWRAFVSKTNCRDA